MGRYRRYLIALAIVVVLVGIYAALGFLAVPHFARTYAQDFVRTHYHRELGIGEIRFNPFTLDLDISKLSLPDADGTPMLSFEHLHVDLQFASIWRLGPSFHEIILDQPYVHAVLRPDGALNLADLGKGFPPPPSPPPKPSPPMRLFIQRFAVLSGSSIFDDRSHATPFRADFRPIAFELRDFSTRAATGNDYALDAASPEGEKLHWAGTVHLAPLASRGQFEISELKARTVWNYLRASLPFEIAAGVIGIKGEYDLENAAQQLELGVKVHSVLVDNLGIRPRGGAEDYVDLQHLAVEETAVDVTKRTVEIAKVQLSGGNIKAWLNEQHQLNLQELAGTPPAAAAGGTAAPDEVNPAPAPAAPPPAAPPPASGPPANAAASAWSVSVPDIALQNFKIAAEDRTTKPAATLLLAPLNVHVAGFNLTPDDTLDVTLDTGVNESGKISAKAKVTPKTSALTAHVETSGLPLTALQPYIAQHTSMTLLKGALGSKLDIERKGDGALSVTGSTEVFDLRTVDNRLKQDFIKWKELRVSEIRYSSQPMSVRIGNITALAPYVRMIIAPDRSINISEVLAPPGSKKSAPAEAQAVKVADEAEKKKPARGKKPAAAPVTAPAAPLTPFPMSIGTIRLVDGSANYADFWIKPSFAVGIQALGGTITGLSSDPRSRAKIELNGKLDRYSPVHIGGELNLLSAALYTDVTMSFKDVDLTIVNPYSGHFVGYKIDKGKLSVDVTYKVDQRKLDAKQHFVVDQLELGDRVESPDAIHAPVKLAVALLRDRNGVIDLDLPMNGSLDDPQFRIGPIIWKIFVNIIVKAATAPFALIGHLFGGGEHVNVVEFDPGSAELQQPAKEQLASIAKALQDRPQLKLDVPIAWSKTIDQPKMAAAQLHDELQARAQGSKEGKKEAKKHPDTAAQMALADPAEHFKLLLAQFQADLGKDAPLPPSVVAVQQAKRKEPPPYDAAINDLQAALLEHVQVTDAELEALGKQRAQAIQDALLADGQIDPARVFIVNNPPKAEGGDKVKVEMAVK
jgi:Domain of Unknown Function (DUF748)